MENDYQQFLESKRHSSQNFGIEPEYMPAKMFPYQRYVAEYAIRKGRCAVFLDTGLGKTLIEITTAVNYSTYTGRPVLIITPLAVAFQFIKEAEKFGIEGVQYSKDGKFDSKIVVANYERLSHFNAADFDCVILDESSILKNFDGAIKNQVTTFMRKVKYRFLFTATPSPNDFVELGTSSEALGYLGYTDMLTKFFKNNEDTVSPQNIGTEWRLKGHAENAFFEWVSGWSISARKPSDLGFDDTEHILPELKTNYHSVKNRKPLCINGQMQLFNIVAKTNSEILAERRATIEDRCEEAANLALQHDISMLWCNLDTEGDLLEKLIPGSIQISGKDSLEKKEEAISWFVGDKCICNSRNFRNKLATSCGNQNTQKQGGKNIGQTNQSATEERSKEEHPNKTSNICENTTQKSLKNSSKPQTNYDLKTRQEEGNTLRTPNIGSDASPNQSNGRKTIPESELLNGLENTELQPQNTTTFSNDKMEAVQYVESESPALNQKATGYTLTTATQQEKSEGCFAQTAITESENLETARNYSNQPQCICGHKSGVRRLISKTRIFGFGLNLQHCNHTVFFPTFSYEQYYQAIRRFWRFGQTRPVTVDVVFSDGQKRVLDSLVAKTQKANDLFNKLNINLNKSYEITHKEFNKEINLPSFLKK